MAYKRRWIAEIATNIAESDNEEPADQFDELLQKNQASSDIQVIANTIRRTMIEIAQIKERNRERQHRELMDLLRQNLTYETDAVRQTMPQVIVSPTKNAPVPMSPAVNLVYGDKLPIPCTSHIKKSETKAVIEETDFLLAALNAPPTSQTNSPKKSLNSLAKEERHHHMLTMQRQKLDDRGRKKREDELPTPTPPPPPPSQYNQNQTLPH